jgi:plastocyanin
MIRRGALVAAVLAAGTTFAPAQAGSLDLPARDVAAVQDTPLKAKVLVKDNFFEPRSTQVLEDGRVTWSWRGMSRHNVAFTKVPVGASRRGARTRTEGRWKRTFHKPGVYRYVCRLWAGMRGTVTVRPEPKPPPQQ